MVHVWNINEVNNTDRGVDLMDVYGSTDGTLYNFITQLSVAEGNNGVDQAVETLAIPTTSLQYVRFDIVSNHAGTTYISDSGSTYSVMGEGHVGLAEVRFSSAVAVPEPSAMMSLALAGFCGVFLRRKKMRR